MQVAVIQGLDSYDMPTDEPVAPASCVAFTAVAISAKHVAVGTPLPETPLFLRGDREITFPLERTYRAVSDGMAAFQR
jgi:hypothetical protein